MNRVIKSLKAFAVAGAVVVSSVGLMPTDAEAKRLGGGGSIGRSAPSMPQKSAPTSAPSNNQASQQSNVSKQTAAPQTAPQKRSWLGPIAGLAAGLGLAALFSSLGLGEGMANFFLMLMMGLVAFFVIRKIMAAMRGNQPAPAYAGQGAGPSAYRTAEVQQPARQPEPQPILKEQAPFAPASSGSSQGQSAWESFGGAQSHQSNFDLSQGFDQSSKPVKALPAGFDEAAFVANAHKFFVMMQGLFDKGDIKGLGEYCSDDVLEHARADLAQRGAAANVTEVLNLEVELLGFETDLDEQLATVVYRGQIREDSNGFPESFEEIWLLTRSVRGGGWVLSGIHNL